ncbi:MAG: hypothetical protein A2V98_20685 [Planctomycetes bacterium RBG_16_64_12]|nr:MAG: hypothetical protein A2V98_20685 [Planctomycetes bacterium RBG_16_64_12]
MTTTAVHNLDPARVKPFAGQPRKRFRGIAKLAESIRLVGQVTPIIVTDSADPGFDAELIDGERRLRACLEGGMKIKAVFEDVDGEDRYLRSVAANFCRQGHDPIEIMDAVATLERAGRTRAEIAGIFGTTVSWVCQYSRLTALAPELIEELKRPDEKDRQSKGERRAGGKLSLSVALLLVPFPHDVQRKMLGRIRKGNFSMAESRTFVKRFAIGAKIQVGKKQSDISKFRTVAMAVDNCRHVVDRYVNMPGAKIQPLVASATCGERKILAASLESLCESLLMLGDALAP